MQSVCSARRNLLDVQGAERVCARCCEGEDVRRNEENERPTMIPR
jgi:hypothetical protein